MHFSYTIRLVVNFYEEDLKLLKKNEPQWLLEAVAVLKVKILLYAKFIGQFQSTNQQQKKRTFNCQKN